MDRDAIRLAIHDISMMVQVLLNAIETMHGNDATPRLSRCFIRRGDAFVRRFRSGETGQGPTGRSGMRLINLLIMRWRLRCIR